MEAVSREYPWANVAALARACTKDVERAAQALKNAKRPRIHTFIATSDIHLKFKLKKSRQQVLEDAVAAVALARELRGRRGVLGRRRRPHGPGATWSRSRAPWWKPGPAQ